MIPSLPQTVTVQQVIERSFQSFLNTDNYLSQYVKEFTFNDKVLEITSVDPKQVRVETKIAKIARYLKPLGMYLAINVDGVEYKLATLERQFPCITEFETGYLDDRHHKEITETDKN